MFIITTNLCFYINILYCNNYMLSIYVVCVILEILALGLTLKSVFK